MRFVVYGYVTGCVDFLRFCRFIVFFVREGIPGMARSRPIDALRDRADTGNSAQDRKKTRWKLLLVRLPQGLILTGLQGGGSWKGTVRSGGRLCAGVHGDGRPSRARCLPGTLLLVQPCCCKDFSSGDSSSLPSYWT
jgi:hypothetical protein